jgi:hypothetical protein
MQVITSSKAAGLGNVGIVICKIKCNWENWMSLRLKAEEK